MISFSLVILSFTKNQDTFRMNKDCINSFIQSAHSAKVSYEIILVESNKNANYDYQNKYIKIIKPNENFNFHKFGNIGLRKAEGEFFVFSNNDVLFDENWLVELCKVINSNKEVKSFSPYDKSSNSIPESLIKKSKLIYGYDIQKHLTGWCIVMHKGVYKTIGALDERFNFYYADNDYAMQLQKYNIKHALVTNAKAKHLESKTSNKSFKSFNLPKNIPKYVIKENRSWILENPEMIKGLIQYHKKWGSRKSIKLKLLIIEKLKMIGLDHFSRFVLIAK